MSSRSSHKRFFFYTIYFHCLYLTDYLNKKVIYYVSRREQKLSKSHLMHLVSTKKLSLSFYNKCSFTVSYFGETNFFYPVRTFDDDDIPSSERNVKKSNISGLIVKTYQGA